MVWSLACLWPLSILLMNKSSLTRYAPCLLIYFLVGDVYATVRHSAVLDQGSAAIVFWRFLTSLLLCGLLAALIYVGDRAIDAMTGRSEAR